MNLDVSCTSGSFPGGTYVHVSSTHHLKVQRCHISHHDRCSATSCQRRMPPPSYCVMPEQGRLYFYHFFPIKTVHLYMCFAVARLTGESLSFTGQMVWSRSGRSMHPNSITRNATVKRSVMVFAQRRRPVEEDVELDDGDFGGEAEVGTVLRSQRIKRLMFLWMRIYTVTNLHDRGQECCFCGNAGLRPGCSVGTGLVCATGRD